VLTRILLISLLLCLFAVPVFAQSDATTREDFVIFVYKAGEGGDATFAGPFCTKAAWDASGDPLDFMGSDGQTLASGTLTVVTGTGSGEVRFYDPGANNWFAGMVSGTGVYIESYTGDDVLDGWFLAEKVDDNTIGLLGTSDGDDVSDTADFALGGAADGLADLITNASDLINAGIYNCDILIKGPEGDQAAELSIPNGGSGDNRLSLIGVDTDWVPLTNGNYVEFTDTNDDAAGDIFEISVSNVTLENIAAKNPGGAVNPGATEKCFNAAAAVEFVARNCRAINGYEGFSMALGGSLIDCVAYDNVVAQVYLTSHGGTVLGGYFENNRTQAYAGVYVIRTAGIGTKVVGATIVGSATGVYLASYGSQLIFNNTFKDQTVQGIVTTHADTMLLCVNNIFKLVNGSNDYEVTLTAGSMYSDYNMSNVITANTRLTGANDVANLTGMSDTSPWVNAAKETDNYKLDRADPLVAYALEAGWSPYSIAGIQGAQSIGAFPTYDLPEKTSVVAPDTVYGIEGTAAGGGGGGVLVHPGMTGGIGG